ncbi:MAG: substrate-binding domain-containing protein [Acidobacteriota bacterium]
MRQVRRVEVGGAGRIAALPVRLTRPLVAALLVVVGVVSAGAQTKKPAAPAAAAAGFRVCADPDNLPASNRKLEGFENKIATVMAKELGEPLSYVFWGQRRGFIRNTMNATLKEGRCDVMIGVPQGYDLVQTTRPYYRSTYVFVYPRGKGLQIKTLDDPILKKLRIGVHLLGDDYVNPPPVHALSQRGVVGNVVGFDTFYSAANPPDTIIEALVGGRIDVAIVWGPAVGNFVIHHRMPLEMVPVPSGKGDLPFAFDISMGVKKGDEALRARVQQALDRKQPEIENILKAYGVPLLNGKGDAK